MNIGNVLLALIVFSLIIIFHEFGHFIVAKYNKVGVIEFSLGMGPRLISWGKTPGGRRLLFFKSSKYFEEHPEFDENTVYSWKLLPFGGSCMMLGEEEEVDDDKAFGKKSVLARMAIIFAGPFFNFILAFLLSLILVGCYGYSAPVVGEVAENGPLAKAGVKSGDRITAINGKKIVLSGEISYYKVFHPFTGEAIEISVDSNGEKKTVTATPELAQNESGGQEYMLGFSYGKNVRTGIWGTAKYSAYTVKYYISTTLQSLWWMVRGKVGMKDISGPVGIVKVVSENVEAGAKAGKDEQGHLTKESVANVIFSLLTISILLTANLGVMNLIPIPALDGGRLLFLFIEWVRKKPLPTKAEAYVNMAGFMLLMAFMVFILFSDVLKLFK